LQFNSGSAPEFFNGEVSQYKWFFWISALAALLITWLIANILQSRYGRAWRAVRSNSTAAELVGIHSARSKVLAFTLASGIAGLAGAVLALNLGGVSPSAYPLSLSFALITGAVLAGISTLSGSVIGALLLVGMSELVGSLTSRFSLEDVLAENLKELLVSVLLILAVVFTPNGPGDRIRERKELHKKKK
jgi:branched-chain amino acid transport system permease protein